MVRKLGEHRIACDQRACLLAGGVEHGQLEPPAPLAGIGEFDPEVVGFTRRIPCGQIEESEASVPLREAMAIGAGAVEGGIAGVAVAARWGRRCRPAP